MKTHKLTLAFDKATKNTMKFSEVSQSGQPPVVDVLYIKKWACPEGTGPGSTVTLTLDIVEKEVAS